MLPTKRTEYPMLLLLLPFPLGLVLEDSSSSIPRGISVILLKITPHSSPQKFYPQKDSSFLSSKILSSKTLLIPLLKNFTLKKTPHSSPQNCSSVFHFRCALSI